jgi:hypothetical protein
MMRIMSTEASSSIAKHSHSLIGKFKAFLDVVTITSSLGYYLPYISVLARSFLFEVYFNRSIDAGKYTCMLNI